MSLLNGFDQETLVRRDDVSVRPRASWTALLLGSLLLLAASAAGAGQPETKAGSQTLSTFSNSAGAPSHAFAPEGEGPIKLGSLGDVAAADWSARPEATDNAGQVAGSGLQTAVPEPESYALMLAGLAAISALARRRKRPEPKVRAQAFCRRGRQLQSRQRR
jgi:hypothetical protein